MSNAMVGIVYYADDPDKKVFRIVYPSDPAHLDGPALETDPATDKLRVMRDEYGNPHGWHTFGVDPKRKTVFEKVPADDPRVRHSGTV